MYKFDATLLIAGADHPATVAYNPIDESVAVEFADEIPIAREFARNAAAAGNPHKIFVHALIEPYENIPQRQLDAVRNTAGLALEAQGWIVENF